MANQLKTKFIGSDQVTSEKVLLQNNTALRSKDSSDVTQDILKLDATDKIIVYRSSGAEEIAYQSDIAAVTGDFVLDAGDTMSGSLVIDGSTAAVPAEAEIQVKDFLDNTKISTLDAYSLSSNHEFQVSGATSLSLDAGGATAEITMTASEINMDAATIDVNGAMYIEENKIALDASSGYELRFDNTSPDAGTYLSSGSDIFLSPGSGNYVYTSSVKTQIGTMYSVDKVTGNPDSATTNEGSISFGVDSVLIDANAGTGTINMMSKVDMGQHDLLNASKLEVKDDLNNVALDVKKQYLNYQNASSNSLLFVDRENLFSNTSFIGSLDGTKNAGFTSVFQTGILEGSVINAADASASLDSKVEATITSGNPQSKMLASNATDSGSMTIVPASASIAVTDVSNSATYAFSPTTFDMDGNKIVDVQQLENLSAATATGNAVRWDEVGQYDATAGYGLATLGADGKILAEQLPAAVMEYKGTWDASTNTPTLANGNPPNAPEDAGHLYKVSVGGTVDFGAGNITFNAGDTVILSAALIWEKSSDANLVTSVNNLQGVVVLNSDDLKYPQSQSSDWTVASNSSLTLTLDEVGSRLTSNENDISAITDDVGHLVTLSGVAVDSDDLGTFTGTTIPNSQTIKQALQALETAHEEVDQNANDLIALSGVAENSIDLGSFTGSTIPDSQTMKQALQSLETAHENHINDTVDAHDASAISLSPAINGQTEVQSAMGDHETRIDALEAVVYAAPFKKTLVAGDITNGYIDLPFLAVQTDGMRVCVDRLQMHQGASEDYSLSTVGGVTRITFLNDMVSPGPQQLSSGDNIYVVYQKNA